MGGKQRRAESPRDRTVPKAWTSGRERDVSRELFTEPSRPGRLMGVTACQDLHEMPRTPLLGLPERPGQRPPPLRGADRGERRADLGDEQLRDFHRGEVAAVVEQVV